MPGLIPKEAFIGIEHVAHLAAGGEAPILRSHLDAASRFLLDKGGGMPGRERFEVTTERAKATLAALLGGRPEEVAFLANASEGLFVVAHGIDWRPGDNVVVERVEFPSGLYAWQGLRSRGVEVRAVGSGPVPSLDEIREAADARTRVLVASHVSFLTGARHDLAALRRVADAVGARLVVDASHALGVVPVPGELCDAVVSCCYKWLLAIHGVGVLYVNARRWPDLAPPWVGWHSVVREEDWRRRDRYQLKATAERFEPGNVSFIGVYILDNALETLVRVGIERIEAHVLALGGALREGLAKLGLPPREIEAELRQAGVITWAGDGRVRLSVHAYNDDGDVSRALEALARRTA
ncbi:MAG: aminotransferase class V-fold PLP-dependent enzyme [Candidatus Rokubacteria bacterium]|nr:aminotransferase class V-fold PLP-dependent enzyme [Candidatus Rokubacteria bacterium]